MKNRLDYIYIMLVSNQRDSFRPQAFFLTHILSYQSSFNLDTKNKRSDTLNVIRQHNILLELDKNRVVGIVYLTPSNKRFHLIFFNPFAFLSQLIHIKSAFPTTWFSGTKPQKRLSAELCLLSPISQ